MFGIRKSFTTGVGFGLTSGIITTLGLMVGLYSGTQSESVVVSGILIIAFTDALSDALGMHISQEADKANTHKEVWESTFATFFTKLIIALTFVVPVLLLELPMAIIISIIWGVSLISLFSALLARQNKQKAWGVVSEHVIIVLLVVIATYYIGEGIAVIF